jgi:NADPH:quinone reductase-like Zn-dependent oxidoreductase
VRAVVCTGYGPPEVLELAEVEDPIPRGDEVRVRIHATAVTASDCIVRSGNVSAALWLPMRIAVGFTRPRQPILGMVLAGEVESLGRGASRFELGEKVFAFDIRRFGAYAELKCIREDGVVAPMPSNATFEEAAAVPFGGMLALHFLKEAGVRSGQHVLVYGASGAVGTSAVQLAKHLGARVTAVCSTRNLEMVESLGADDVVDYTREDFRDRGERYDLVFNAVGKRKARLDTDGVLADDGRHVTVDDGNPELFAEDLVYLKELFEAGELVAVVDSTYPLEEIVEAHRYVDRGRKRGNVIVTIAR